MQKSTAVLAKYMASIEHLLSEFGHLFYKLFIFIFANGCLLDYYIIGTRIEPNIAKFKKLLSLAKIENYESFPVYSNSNFDSHFIAVIGTYCVPFLKVDLPHLSG